MEGGLGGGGVEGTLEATKEADQTGKKHKMARRDELRFFCFVFLAGAADKR